VYSRDVRSVALVACLLVACRTPAPPLAGRSTDAYVRFDGLYTTAPTPEPEPTRAMLRFYADKTVLAVTTLGAPDEIVEWFKKGHAHSSTGTYEIYGTSLKFSTKSRDGVVDYEGTIRGETIELRWHSHINNESGSHAYRFTRVDVQ